MFFLFMPQLARPDEQEIFQNGHNLSQALFNLCIEA